MAYYPTWLQETALLCGTVSTNPNFLIEAPFAIQYAELRLIRDLDLSNLISTDFSQVTTPNLRTVPIPTLPISGFFTGLTIVNAVNIITPAGQTNPELGKRNPLERVSSDYLDFMWPSSAGAQLPTLWSTPRFSGNLNQTQILLGPWPDQAYTVEYVGEARPLPLSQVNQDTFISSFLPDIFLIATMIHLTAYKQNWGAQADDPRMAISYEQQYQKLLSGCDAEELRRRYTGTSVLPIPGTAKQPASPGAAKQ